MKLGLLQLLPAPASLSKLGGEKKSEIVEYRTLNEICNEFICIDVQKKETKK